MSDYNVTRSSLNQKPKPEEKKVEKIVTGSVQTKKRSGVRKLTDAFIAEDVSNIKNYIVGDVLIPAAKKAIVDVITNSIDMLFYGEVGHTKKSSNASRISYNSLFDSSRPKASSALSSYNYDDIVLNSRDEAEEVLIAMSDLVERYGMASVSDYYELVGVTGTYTDCNYGWKDLHMAKILRNTDGYMIKLPKAVPLK